MSEITRLDENTAHGRSPILTLLRLSRYIPLAAAGAWLVYSYTAIDHEMTLLPAIDAERRTFANREAGVLSYYVDRSAKGRPLVLIHSINAAASAYEMLPLFNHFRDQRPVYALDLPGFGFSDRMNRTYSPQMYRDAVLALLQTQVKEQEPADVIALSLGSEFVALAAQARPELINSLTLISPTGFMTRARRSSVTEITPSQPVTSLSDRVLSMLQFPLWSQPIFDLLATRKSIRYFYKLNFEGKVDPGLENYAYLTAHRPGARYAPLHFISGKLFTRGIRETVYEHLTMPVLVIYDHDPNVGFDELPGTLARRPNWQAARIAPTRGLPHFEKLQETADAMERFWVQSQQDQATK